MTFDEHKRHLASEYAALVHKHREFPAVKQYIWGEAKRLATDLATRDLYGDLPKLIEEAVRDRAQAALPGER